MKKSLYNSTVTEIVNNNTVRDLHIKSLKIRFLILFLKITFLPLLALFWGLQAMLNYKK